MGNEMYFRFFYHPEFGDETFLVVYNSEIQSDDPDELFNGNEIDENIYTDVCELVGSDCTETGIWEIEYDDIDRVRDGMANLGFIELDEYEFEDDEFYDENIEDDDDDEWN